MKSKFDLLFRPAQTSSLDEAPFIGLVTKLDIGSSRQLLITDQMTNQVHIVTGNGEYEGTLDPEECRLSDRWRPFAASFLSDDAILVTNSVGPPGVIFDMRGVCRSRMMAEEYMAPRHLAVGSDGRIFGRYTNRHTLTIKGMRSTGETIWETDAGSDFIYLNRGYMGGGIAFLGEDLAVVDVQSTMPRLLDRDSGTINSEFKNHPSFVRPIEDDIAAPNRDPVALQKRLSLAMDGKSLVLDLFTVSNSCLLVKYLLARSIRDNPDSEYGYALICINGDSLSMFEFTTDIDVVAAGYGAVCVLRTAHSNPGYRNPAVEFYEFRNGAEVPDSVISDILP